MRRRLVALIHSLFARPRLGQATLAEEAPAAAGGVAGRAASAGVALPPVVVPPEHGQRLGQDVEGLLDWRWLQEGIQARCFAPLPSSAARACNLPRPLRGWSAQQTFAHRLRVVCRLRRTRAPTSAA